MFDSTRMGIRCSRLMFVPSRLGRSLVIEGTLPMTSRQRLSTSLCHACSVTIFDKKHNYEDELRLST